LPDSLSGRARLLPRLAGFVRIRSGVSEEHRHLKHSSRKIGFVWQQT
jgi:hypothetical protein